MADTETTHYDLIKPEVGASADTWGGKINDNLDAIDTQMKATADAAALCMLKTQNLNDVADKPTARTNLGVAIGTNVQAYHANHAAFAGLTFAANTLAYGNGAGTLTTMTFTAAGRALLDDTDAAAQRTTLGLGSLSTLSAVNNDNWSGTDLAVANGGTGASTAADARTALGLTIGTNVQAYSATLLTLASTTAAGLALMDDTDAAAQRTTLGLGTAAVKATGTSGNTVPLLDGANTWSAAQGLPAASTVDSKRIARMAAGSDANTGKISVGTAAPGTLDVGEIYLRHA